jgi:hypothetical protein
MFALNKFDYQVFKNKQVYCSHAKVGKMGFKDMPPTCCICIIEDKITEGMDYYQRFMLRNENGQNFSNLVEINLIELGKFGTLQHEYDKITTEMEELVYTLKYVHTFSVSDLIKKPDFWEKMWYMDVLNKLNLNRMDPIYKAIYEMSVVRDKLRLEKLAIEFQEVRDNEKEIRITKALLKGKIEVEDIAELFDVSLEYVMQIKQELDKNKS